MRISTDHPSAIELYRSLHRLYDETNSQEALDLLEAAENCVAKCDRLTSRWFIEGVRVLLTA